MASPPPAEPSRSPLRSETPTHADLHVSISYAEDTGGGGSPRRNVNDFLSGQANGSRHTLPFLTQAALQPARHRFPIPAFPAYGSPGGTQVTGTTSVNDFLSGQVTDHLQRRPERTSKRVPPFLTQAATHNPPSPTTHGSTTNASRRRRWWRRRRWTVPTGGTIAITAPVGNADQHADLQVSISYASGGGGYQTPNWAYRIDSAFPAYGSPHGGTQVTGTTSVNDFLSGQANGSRHATSPFLTQAATSTTRPSPTTHGSTTNTSRPAAVVEAAAEDNPPPAEPSRSPLRSETPTSTPTCRYPSPTHRAAEDTRRPIGPTGSIPPSRPMDHPTAEPKSPGPPRSTTS